MNSRRIDRLIPILMSFQVVPDLNSIAFSYVAESMLAASPLYLVERLAESQQANAQELDPEIPFFLNMIGATNVSLLEKLFPNELRHDTKSEITKTEFGWDDYLAYSTQLKPKISEKIQLLLLDEPDTWNQSVLIDLVKLYCNDPRNTQEIQQLIMDWFKEAIHQDHERGKVALKKISLFSQYIHLPDTVDIIPGIKQSDEPIYSLAFNIIGQDRIKKLTELFPDEVEGWQADTELSPWQQATALFQHLTMQAIKCVKFFAEKPLPLDAGECRSAGLPYLLPMHISLIVQMYCEDYVNKRRNVTIKNFFDNWLDLNTPDAIAKIIYFVKREATLPDVGWFIPKIYEKGNLSLLKSILNTTKGKELVSECDMTPNFILSNIKHGNLQTVTSMFNSIESLVENLNYDEIYKSVLKRKDKAMLLLLDSFKNQMVGQFLGYQLTCNDFFGYAIAEKDKLAIQFLLQTAPMTDVTLLATAYRKLRRENADLFYEVYHSFVASTESKDVSLTWLSDVLFYASLRDDKRCVALFCHDFPALLTEPKYSKPVLKNALSSQVLLAHPKGEVANFMLAANTQLMNYGLMLCIEGMNEVVMNASRKNLYRAEAIQFYKQHIVDLITQIDDLMPVLESLKKVMYDEDIFKLLIKKMPSEFMTPAALCQIIRSKQNNHIEIMLSELKEAKNFNINALQNGALVLCEAIAQDIDLADRIIRKHRAKCSPAIVWMMQANRADLFNHALKLEKFKKEVIEIAPSLKDELCKKKDFVMALLVNGIPFQHPDTEKYNKLLEGYQNVLKEMEGEFENPTEKIIHFLLKTTWRGLRVFTSPGILLDKIEKNPGKIEDIVKQEIATARSKAIPDEDYFLKLLFIQSVVTPAPTPASIKTLRL